MCRWCEWCGDVEGCMMFWVGVGGWLVVMLCCWYFGFGECGVRAT